MDGSAISSQSAARLPRWLWLLNLVSGFVFLGLGLKGYGDHKSRWYAIGSLGAMLSLAAVGAYLIGKWTGKVGQARCVMVGTPQSGLEKCLLRERQESGSIRESFPITVTALTYIDWHRIFLPSLIFCLPVLTK